MVNLFEGLPSDGSSQAVAFSRNDLDRRAEQRTPEMVERVLGDLRTNYAVIVGNRIVVDPTLAPAGMWFSRTTAERLALAFEDEAFVLGWRGDNAYGALIGPKEVESLPEPYKAIDLRSLYVQGLLSPENEGAAGQAMSWSFWHGRHRFCPNCGGQAAIALGGAKRVCANCEAQYFPRIDPVVIMLVTDGERALLGRSPHFPPGMYSCLAGFVEHGETLEMAVRRETFEEAGIEVGRVRYHASQPWPFPHSLMLGVFAEAKSRTISFQDEELEDCRWFTPDEIRTLRQQRGVSSPDVPAGRSSPPGGAIAGHLIDDWLKMVAG